MPKAIQSIIIFHVHNAEDRSIHGRIDGPKVTRMQSGDLKHMCVKARGLEVNYEGAGADVICPVNHARK